MSKPRVNQIKAADDPVWTCNHCGASSHRVDTIVHAADCYATVTHVRIGEVSIPVTNVTYDPNGTLD